ncbi:MAG: D-glycero-beta-D-manno-heptose-7-phosphate kinase [Candidatus Omnitrophica bacterium]|nr:D-glycero-beta-D-manno-heptose-7-phosphate kinase [Candidatus Omnitrophota bacterium]
MEKVVLKKIIDNKRFDEITGKYSKTEVIVAGDLILDRFIYGSVSRISPEAPVPVVVVQKEEQMLGGAGNVALNIKTLGGNPFLIASLGRDRDGRVLKEILEDKSIDSFLIERDSTTITKTRVIARTQQVVRIDREDIKKLTDEDILNIKKTLDEKIKNVSGIIISDYSKGFITKKLISIFLTYKKKYGKILTVDPKVEHFTYYKNVTCITPNRAEASDVMHIKEPELLDDIRKLGTRIKKRIGCEHLLITLGKDGMMLFENCGNVIHIPTVAKEVFDVTGAGDTVIAVFTLSLSAGASVIEAAIISNIAAGITVAKLGTASTSQNELREIFREVLEKEFVNIM